MSLRVLMIGPGEEVTGGISAVTETVVPVLNQHVDLFYMPTVRQRALKESGKISRQNVALAISQYARFLCALYRFHPHIIHLHTSQGIAWLKDTLYVLIAKVYRCRIVIQVHAADFDELYGKKSRLIQHYTRKVMGLADAIIAVSSEWKRRLAQIAPDDRIFAFRNCISVDTIPPHVSTNGAKALFLGSVGPRKGAFDLLEAMGRLKSRSCPLQVWIAGYEEREGDLLRAGARHKELQLGESYQLVGTVRGAKKAELLSKANFFVLPSYDEGLPMAVLEAMAAGLPIIATPVGGIPEVVRDNYNGFLITPGDVDTLAEKLTTLSNDRQLRDIMGTRSRQIAENELDVKPYVKRLVALYESMIHK
jgi:glycosyltransferase involved in cell wall biosynthesis